MNPNPLSVSRLIVPFIVAICSSSTRPLSLSPAAADLVPLRSPNGFLLRGHPNHRSAVIGGVCSPIPDPPTHQPTGASACGAESRQTQKVLTGACKNKRGRVIPQRTMRVVRLTNRAVRHQQSLRRRSSRPFLQTVPPSGGRLRRRERRGRARYRSSFFPGRGVEAPAAPAE